MNSKPFLLFSTLALLAGCSSTSGESTAADAPASPPSAAPASSQASASPESDPVVRASRDQWRRTMSKIAAPKDGCFTVTYPSTTWVEVPCTQAPDHPLVPGKGTGSPTTVGNGGGRDFSAVVSGTTSWAEGSFPTVSGVTDEHAGTNSGNTYSLQLNTNTFSTPACNGAASPASCVGWEQFVYEGTGGGFIQYWLINYGNTCPSGWWTFGSDCFRNSSTAVSAPAEPITDLGSETVTGTAGSSDTLTVSVGNGTLYQLSQSSILGLNTAWTTSEFNVFGDSGGDEAAFNAGSTVVVRTLTDSVVPTTSAPSCVGESFTGETNNMTLVGSSCCPFGGDTPGIQFTESNAANPVAQACPLVYNFHEFTGANATGGDVGSYAYDSAGNSQVNWVAANSGQNAQESTWDSFHDLSYVGSALAGQVGVAIDVGAAGPWVLNSSATNNIWGSPSGGSFGQVYGTAGDIGVSNDGKTVYVVGKGTGNQQLYKYVGGAPVWAAMAGQSGVRVDAANDGSAWVVNALGGVWHVTGTPTSPTSAPIGPSFTNATDITVGGDGSVFVVGQGTTADHAIYLYAPGSNTFNVIPGAAGTRISAASAASVTVVNAEGQIWTTATHFLE